MRSTPATLRREAIRQRALLPSPVLDPGPAVAWSEPDDGAPPSPVIVVGMQNAGLRPQVERTGTLVRHDVTTGTAFVRRDDSGEHVALRPGAWRLLKPGLRP